MDHSGLAKGVETDTGGDDSEVAALVNRARDGDETAWDALVDRFTPLVMAVARRYRLTPDDAGDVGQLVWLRLVQHLNRLREPAALPGWIRTTTSRECLRIIREGRRTLLRDPLEPTSLLDVGVRGATDTEELEQRLIREQQLVGVLEAFALLSTRQRELLTLLLTDPPPSYHQISKALDIPVGAIGPTRARAIASLRRGLARPASLEGVRHVDA